MSNGDETLRHRSKPLIMMQKRRSIAFLCVISCCWTEASPAHHAAVAPTRAFIAKALQGIPRGGSNVVDDKPKKKKRKKKTAKAEVAKAMKDSDSGKALGDAIRDRASTLRGDDLTEIDATVNSVGLAMGTSEGGGVEAAPNSVLAHYFLKSHGGAHAFQCFCSLMATLSATGCLVSPRTSTLKQVCLKRALQFAMAKHASGLLAACTKTASAIPNIGLQQARLWMEQLAKEPVSQYLFYTSLLLLWIPSKLEESWFWKPPYSKVTPLLLVGPILLREAISTAFVLSDIMVLLTSSQEQVPALLQVSHSIVNAFMSVLVTPSKWRTATSSQKQETLAKLVSRICLILEVGVGLLLIADSLHALWQQSFASERPSLLGIAKRLLCARLYYNYLLVRKKAKIQRLASNIRGGASQVPMRVLELLLDPRGSMGLEEKTTSEESSWMGLATTAMGFDE